MSIDTRIYYFSAKWCGPCKTFKPIMEKLEAKGYPIYFQDVDEDPILAESYSIRSVPSIVITEDGLVKEQMVGIQDLDLLLGKFDAYYPGIQLTEEEVKDEG